MQARSFRCIAALVAVLLVGLLLQSAAGAAHPTASATGATGATSAAGAASADDAPARPVPADAHGSPEADDADERAARAIGTDLGPLGPAFVVGPTWVSAWPWAVARAAGLALGVLVGAAALLAAAETEANRARPLVAWCLVRPDHTRATARRRSPLAARRAPPAPAACS